MVHLFAVAGERFAFDSVSGALHQLDDAAFSLVERYVQTGGVLPEEQRDHPLVPVVENLIISGQLFAAQPVITLDRLYPDGPAIKALCLNLCHDCNLRCQYCFAGTGDYGGERGFLDEETGRQAIDFLIRNSGPRRHLDIDFFGGEPLLNWPVVQKLTAYAEEVGPRQGKEIRLTITTNANLLDDEKIDFVNAHFRNVVLSLDGRQAVHDRVRPYAGGQGSWARTVERIRRFVDRRGDREYHLRGTFTALNLDFAEDVRALAELAPYVSIEPVVLPPEHPLAIREEHLPQIEAEYERLAVWLEEREAEGRPVHFFHFAIDLDHGPCALKRYKGCGLGSEYVAVTPEGDVYPCHQLIGEEPLRLGHVSQAEDWNQVVYDGFAKRLTDLLEECSSCFARLLCGGGCAANRYHAGGDFGAPDPIGCRLLRKRFELALWLYARRRARKERRPA